MGATELGSGYFVNCQTMTPFGSSSESESGLEQQWVPDLPALWIADHYLSPPKAEPKAPRTVANR